MRTIHVYRAARNYFIDGIYGGDDAEDVRFYLQVTGVPTEAITKALAEVAQEGTTLIHQERVASGSPGKISEACEKSPAERI
jgi:hypothetical protein